MNNPNKNLMTFNREELERMGIETDKTPPHKDKFLISLYLAAAALLSVIVFFPFLLNS